MLTIELPSHDAIASEHEMQALIIKSMQREPSSSRTRGQCRLQKDMLRLLSGILGVPEIADTELRLYSEFDFIDLVFELPQRRMVVGVELKWKGGSEIAGQTLRQTRQLRSYFPGHDRAHVLMSCDGAIPQSESSIAVTAVSSPEFGTEPGLQSADVKKFRSGIRSSSWPEARIVDSLPEEFGSEFVAELCDGVEAGCGRRFVVAHGYRGDLPARTTNEFGWGEGRYLRLVEDKFSDDRRCLAPMSSDNLIDLPLLFFQLSPFGVGLDCMFSSLATAEFYRRKRRVHEFLEKEEPEFLMPLPVSGKQNVHFHCKRLLSVVEHGEDIQALRSLAMSGSIEFICRLAPLYEQAMHLLIEDEA